MILPDNMSSSEQIDFIASSSSFRQRELLKPRSIDTVYTRWNIVLRVSAMQLKGANNGRCVDHILKDQYTVKINILFLWDR